MAGATVTRRLLLDGGVYECRPDETVLETLLRHRVPIPNSCRHQTCLTCVMQSLQGPPPAEAQINLQDHLRRSNFFLACGCRPERDMVIAFPSEVVVETQTAEVAEINRLCPRVIEICLACPPPFPYRGGQFLTVVDEWNVGHRFPIASPTSGRLTGKIEIHVEHSGKGAFSDRLVSSLEIGEILDIRYANGEMTYETGDPRQTLLLVGWNGGLGALIGIMQDAFEHNHTGRIYLLHGASDRNYLYFVDELREVADRFRNFRYLPCVEDRSAPQISCDGWARGAVAAHVRRLLPDLSGVAVFLCGRRSELSAMQRQCYLAGAAMKDIRTDLSLADDFQ